MKKLACWLILLSGWLAALPVQADGPDSGAAGPVQILTISGPIGPATADYIRSAFAAARSRDAAMIVVTINTPGGLADSMRDIIRNILGSAVPVAGFVYPSGSRAASAGTYILYACHIAAMAPGTNLGAATPIQVGGGLPLPGSKPPPPDDDKQDHPEKPPSPDAMTSKMVNDAVAYIRSLAQLRDRNAEWAEQSVREGASLPVNEALQQQVIDVVASDVDDLLRKIDGRSVSVAGRPMTLATTGLKTETIAPDWRNRLLAVLTNPNIAFILILVGVYGLFFEFSNPGAIGPGVIGAICLLVGFYALNLLPLNYAGLGLLLLAIALMAAEAFLPSFGVLGIGGIVAFVLAAMMLFDRDIPGYRISWPVIGVSAAVSGALMIFLLGYVWRAQRRPVTTGSESWTGKAAVVLEWSGESGYVRCGGERWKAIGKENFAPHERVEVCGHSNLVLHVQKKRNPDK
ncbi:NfeD family protein [Desulfosarcina sp.]|uniref:NfeD family protein n=1 Tax=Desulfosarcina sp. TaxID=2027861 RepID=UPI003970C6A3